MQFRRRIKKFIPILLVIALFVQLLPGTFAYAECSYSHAGKSTVTLSAGTVNTEIPLLTDDGHKTKFHSITTGFYDIISEPLYSIDISEDNSPYYLLLADERKVIQQSIPHYFHGSKYKDGSLII